MRVGSFFYLVKEGARNVWHNRLMSIASIGVLSACLLLIGCALLFSVNVNQAVAFVQNQNEIAVFLQDDLDEVQKTDVDTRIKALEGVASVNFVSREQALADYKEDMGEYGELLDEFVGNSPLPDTYKVKIKDLSQLASVVSRLEAIPGVEAVSAADETADTLVGINHAVTVIGGGIVVLLVVVAVVIMANTIKLTVYNRRREINIMKFVGAKDSFIRLPFLIEGIILGIIAAVVAYGLVWGGYSYIHKLILENTTSWIALLAQSFVPFSALALNLGIGFLVGGVVMGAMGSMLFVRRYLRV